MNGIANSKKPWLSGKQKAIDGKHVITVTGFIGIQEAEKATMAWKSKHS